MVKTLTIPFVLAATLFAAPDVDAQGRFSWGWLCPPVMPPAADPPPKQLPKADPKKDTAKVEPPKADPKKDTAKADPKKDVPAPDSPEVAKLKKLNDELAAKLKAAQAVEAARLAAEKAKAEAEAKAKAAADALAAKKAAEDKAKAELDARDAQLRREQAASESRSKAYTDQKFDQMKVYVDNSVVSVEKKLVATTTPIINNLAIVTNNQKEFDRRLGNVEVGLAEEKSERLKDRAETQRIAGQVTSLSGQVTGFSAQLVTLQKVIEQDTARYVRGDSNVRYADNYVPANVQVTVVSNSANNTNVNQALSSSVSSAEAEASPTFVVDRARDRVYVERPGYTYAVPYYTSPYHYHDHHVHGWRGHYHGHWHARTWPHGNSWAWGARWW